MKKTFLRWILVVGLVFGIFFGAGAGLAKLMQPELPEKEKPVEALEQYHDDGERTNILVLGVDARPGEKRSRSDTMLLVSVDPKADKVAVISIPRDTRIEVKGGYLDKICAANYIGGPAYAVDRVEDLMRTKIDHYVEMDFNGFRQIVDTLGGVTIDVPQRMYKPLEGINLYPGIQKLNGKNALAFVRFRGYINGDIDRTHQQQVFIKALASEVLQPKTITKLPGLVKQLKQYVDTDIGFTGMLKMASWAPHFKSDAIITQTLPGCFYNEVDANGTLLKSYWLADEDEAVKLLDNLFAGKTVAVVKPSPPPTVVGPPAGSGSSENDETSEDEAGAHDEDTSAAGDVDAQLVVGPPAGSGSSENDETSEDEAGVHDKSTSAAGDIDAQRPGLPSPGHNGEIESPPAEGTDPAGPDGYMI